MRFTAKNQVGRTAGIVLAASVPLVLLGNALILLLVPWTADVLYALPGFPGDPLGLAGEDRSALAEVGIRSIWPVGEGTALLQEAQLPDGSAAFQPKETNHMADVSGFVRTGLTLWLVALVAGAVATLALRRVDPRWIRASLGTGARIALFSMLAVALVMVIGFEFFFDSFHAIFFEGDSWRFADYFTLRRIYPDAFWGIAAGVFVLLALAQALLLAHLTTGLPRPGSVPRAQTDQ